jgi:hypothetical protein
MNRYDVEHVVTAHPRMSRADWEKAYANAWSAYYSREHIERMMRRAGAMDAGISRLASMAFWFSSMVAIENVHPLQSGIFRFKYRRDRRPTLPIEPIWRFYPRYAREIATKSKLYFKHWWWIDKLRRGIRKDPNRLNYIDVALTPVDEHDTENLQLFTHSHAAQAAVQHARKIKQLTSPRSAA